MGNECSEHPVYVKHLQNSNIGNKKQNVLSAYCMPGTVPGAGGMPLNKTAHTILGGKQDNTQ